MWGWKKKQQSSKTSLSEQQLWQRYFFERHSLETLIQWSQRLRYFRYCRAYGGHAGDGDSLLVAIRIQSEQELHEVFDYLQLPIVFTALAPSLSDGIDNSIKWSYPQVEPPKHVVLAGIKVFIWTYPDRLKLTITNLEHPTEVTESSVIAAEQLEPFLTPLASKMINPPQDDRYCFIPEHWTK